MTIPEGVEEIRTEAFDRCNNLLSLQLPASLVKIDPTAFSNCRHVMLFVYPDSYAMKYAIDTGIFYTEI